jgi:hypothetical protein
MIFIFNKPIESKNKHVGYVPDANRDQSLRDVMRL